MPADDLLTLIKRVQSIAQIGALYARNDYDKERYAELEQISLAMLSQVSATNVEELRKLFLPVTDYPTAKVDVRGLLLSPDKKILLARESADGKWSLPGGWADVGYSPSEVMMKEFHEETGLLVKPVKLLAVFDKKMHPHPPQPFYVYKVVFLCEAEDTSTLQRGFDVLDLDYFDINHLPELSEDRILKSQLELLYKEYVFAKGKVYFD